MKLGKLLVLLFLSILVITGCSTGDSKADKKEDKVEVSNEEKVDESTESEEVVEETDENTVVEEGKEEVETSEETTREVKEGFTLIDYVGINFEIPEDLINLNLEKGNYNMLGYFLDPNTGTNFNVLVEQGIPEEMTLEEYIELATSMTGYEYLEKNNYTIDDLEWNEAISLNHTQQGTVKLNQRTLLIDGKAYIFSYGSHPDLYEDNLELFKTIIDSVTVVE